MSKKPSAPANIKTLPTKDASHFKQVLKFYESKQYKKGLKLAEQILKNFPEHGETLAMKGLILNCMEKKTEAYEFVRRGIRNDITSHICWHVFGLLYRSDRNYTEAIKCYLNALKHDKKNPQILRDLSLLQVQMRDYKGFVETRRQLLLQKSSNKANWIAYTLAQHLNKDYVQALRAYDAYEDTLEKPWKKNDFELSEMLLYKNQILEESGDLERALSHLHEVQEFVLDKVAVKEKNAELLLKLKRMGEARAAYRELIDLNPDNAKYHSAYRTALGNDTQVKDTYRSLAVDYPKASLISQVQLELASTLEFRTLFQHLVHAGFQKGVPSLFNSFKKFYRVPEKALVIEQVVLELVQSFRSGSDKDDSPLMLLWALFFLAQHYDATGHYEKALEAIDEAIAHTPTAIELYSVKGKIYKHAGNPKLAAHYLDQARNLDLADRYLNTRSTLYYLRADQIDVADRIIALFTKDGAVSSQSNLFEMQCMWYEKECGDSHFRQGEYGKALKKYVAIEKHFADITEDQFDFHTYYIRKMTLRAYVQLLRLEENLYGNKKFYNAAKGIINCYLAIYDKPKNTSSSVEDEFAHLPESERKKALNKKKKAELISKKENKPAEVPKEDPKKKKNTKPQPVDEDPNGDVLANVEDPLGAAIKYLKIIQRNSPNQLDTHLLACEIYIRKKKYLLVLQALKKAISIAPDHPSVHKHTIRLFHDALNESGLHPKVKQLLTEERDSHLKGQSLDQFNNSFLEKNTHSQSHRIEVGRSVLLVDPSKKEEAIQILTAVDGIELTPQIAERVAKTLRELFPKDAQVLNDYKTKVHGIFKFASSFDPNPVSVDPVESIAV